MRPNFKLALATSAAFVFANVATSTAWASPPCACDDEPVLVDYDGVPTNVHVLVRLRSPSLSPFVFVPEAGGLPIPGLVTPAMDDAGHSWIAPEHDLLPNSHYTLTSAGVSPIEIRTGSKHDAAPPLAVGLRSEDNGFHGACDAHIAIQIFPEGLADDGTVPWVRLVFDGATGHHVLLAKPGNDLTRSTTVGALVGGPCGNAPWASTGPYKVWLSAIDHAANESRPVGPFEVTMRKYHGAFCLCTTPGAPANNPSSLVLSSLVTMAWVARRRLRAATQERANNFGHDEPPATRVRGRLRLLVK